MNDDLTPSQNMERGRNGVDAAGGKLKKKSTQPSGSAHGKLQGIEGDAAIRESSHTRSTSKRRGNTRLTRSSSGLNGDGTITIESSKNGAKGKKLKRLSATSAESAESTGASVSTAKSSSSKPSKPKKKPASRSKSFDGCVSVDTANTNGSQKKTTTKKTAPKQPKQGGLRASSEHNPNAVKLKAQQRKQEQSNLSSLHEPVYQTPRNQVVGDLFVKRRPSKQGQNLLVPCIGDEETASKKGSKSNGNRLKKRPSDTSSEDRGRLGASRSEGQPNADPDPTKAYFPCNHNQSASNIPSLAPPSLPSRSRSISKSERRSSSKSRSGSRSSHKSSSKVNKPKLPARTASDSSLQSPVSQNNQPPPLLGPDPDVNDAASTGKPIKSQSSSSKGSILTTNATSANGGESRGSSLLEPKSSNRMPSNNTSNNNSSKAKAQTTTTRGLDQALTPPKRERSISNRGKSRTTGNGGDPQVSLLGGDNPSLHSEGRDIDPLPTEGSWQVDEKALYALSKRQEPQRMRDVAPKKANKNASAPVRKKTSFDDDECEDESDRDLQSKQKSLCGLLPQSKKAFTAESSVSGASAALPELMDSSFSSLYSQDESVCTYLSHKKTGLIVPTEVQEGPMKAFLGSLTSAIEKKQNIGPPSQNSFDDQSFDALQLKDEAKEAESQSKGAGKSKRMSPSLGASLSATLNASGVNILSGSGRPDEEDAMSLPSLMSFGTKAAGSVIPVLETHHEREDDEMSLPSLMSYGTKGAGSVAPVPQRDDDEMSLPSLMSYGVKSRDDGSVCMPYLASHQTKDTAVSDMDMSVGSMPSLMAMPDDPSISSVPALRRENDIRNGNKKTTGNPLYDIEDGDEDDEEEEQEQEEEPYDEGDYGDPYEESMTEIEESDLEENNAENDEASEDDEESEEGETYEEGDAEEEEHIARGIKVYKEDQDDKNEVEQRPVHHSTLQNRRTSGRGERQKSRQPSEQEQPPQLQNLQESAVMQFVVKPKKKNKKSRPEKEKKDAKQEQVQMWQQQFEQEQMMQQQQIFWQQQQQLLQQQMLQQQFWMTNGTGMNNSQIMLNQGVMMVPPQIMDTSPQILNMSTHQTGSSIAGGHRGIGSSDHAGGVTIREPKNLVSKSSHGLEYDFSFMDNPDMPQVSEVSVEDVLQPMNPSSFDECNGNNDDEDLKRPTRGKKEKKAPTLSFTSRFKNSVKKIKSGFGVTKQKSGGKVDTGLNDRQFFPDLDDDDDEESTMKGLLSR